MARKEDTPREIQEKLEPKFLHRLAALSSNAKLTAREHHQEKDDFRTEFQRDYTRIIHSRAFRRLRHKTQVFVAPRNDHLCTRIEHSLHVASIARTISKALGLNNELVAAIAVGHDLGHAPFGHRGEECLDKIARKHGLRFKHELQSLRVVDSLDSTYRRHRGLNLTFAVRDGIACHCGEKLDRKLVPNREKTPAMLRRAKSPGRPVTLEGCVVRWADKIAYLGRDLEDAFALKLVNRRDVPRIVRTTLGTENRDIIGVLIGEIVKQSRDKDCVSVGPKAYEALCRLNKFNYERIYKHEKVRRYFDQVQTSMAAMFPELVRRVKAAQKVHNTKSLKGCQEEPLKVLAQFLEQDIRTWKRENPAQLVIDFIAGMTDNFFIDSFQELFLPKSSA